MQENTPDLITRERERQLEVVWQLIEETRQEQDEINRRLKEANLSSPPSTVPDPK